MVWVMNRGGFLWLLVSKVFNGSKFGFLWVEVVIFVVFFVSMFLLLVLLFIWVVFVVFCGWLVLLVECFLLIKKDDFYKCFV